MSFIGNLTDHRSRVAQEMYDTEKAYVTSLKVVKTLYIDPLRAACAKKAPIVKEQDVTAIFSNLELLLGVNEKLLEQLGNCLLGWTRETTCVSPAFLEMSPFLKMYTQYCHDFDASNARLQECREKNPKFKKFVKKAQQDVVCKNMSLDAFLIMPVQRLPRYVLLMSDMIKHTDEFHPDYQGLTKALTQIKAVADSVNEGVRDAERRSKLLEIERNMSIDIGLVQPHRTVVKTAERVSIQIQLCWREGQIYLLNDLLILASVGQRPEVREVTDSEEEKADWMQVINKAITDWCNVKPVARQQRQQLRDKLEQKKQMTDMRKSLSKEELQAERKKEREARKAERKKIKETKDADKFQTFRF